MSNSLGGNPNNELIPAECRSYISRNRAKMAKQKSRETVATNQDNHLSAAAPLIGHLVMRRHKDKQAGPSHIRISLGEYDTS